MWTLERSVRSIDAIASGRGEQIILLQEKHLVETNGSLGNADKTKEIVMIAG